MLAPRPKKYGLPALALKDLCTDLISFFLISSFNHPVPLNCDFTKLRLNTKCS